MPQLQYCTVHAPRRHKMCTKVLMGQVGLLLGVYTPRYIQGHEFDPVKNVQNEFNFSITLAGRIKIYDFYHQHTLAYACESTVLKICISG